MKTYHDPSLLGRGKGVPCASLPLFEWANACAADLAAPPVPRAAHVIARRHRLPLHLAALNARLAGLGGHDH
jgi:hypothetical protein